MVETTTLRSLKTKIYYKCIESCKDKKGDRLMELIYETSKPEWTGKILWKKRGWMRLCRNLFFIDKLS